MSNQTDDVQSSALSGNCSVALYTKTNSWQIVIHIWKLPSISVIRDHSLNLQNSVWFYCWVGIQSRTQIAKRMENHLVSLLWRAIYFLVLGFSSQWCCKKTSHSFEKYGPISWKSLVITDYHCFSYLELVHNTLFIRNSLTTPVHLSELVRVPPLKP